MAGLPFVLVIALFALWYGASLAPRLHPGERWALGVVLALGLLSLTAFLQRWLGGALPGPGGQLGVLLVGGLGARALGARTRRAATTPSSAPTTDPETTPASQPVRALATRPAGPARVAWLLALALATVTVGDLRQSEPAGGWDGMAIWTMNARQLARPDSDRADSMARRTRGHPGYPLFVSANVALAWQWHEGESQGAPRALALLILFALACGSRGAFSARAGPTLGSLASAALLATPALAAAGRMHAADVALALVALVAASRLAASLSALRDPSDADARSTPGAQVLTGVLLAMLPWVKNEGAVLLGCLALAALPLLWRRAPGRLAALGRLLTGALPVLATWILFKASWAPSDRMMAQLRPAARRFLLDPERWRVAAAGLRDELLPTALDGPWLQRWALLSVLLPLALLLSRRRDRDVVARIVPRALLLWLLCLLGIYTLTIADQRWHMDTSLWRLCLGVLPLALWAALPSASAVPSGRPRSLS